MSMPIQADRAARYVAWTADEAGALQEIGVRMADGETLPQVCKTKDLPYGRVLLWLMGSQERFEVYQRALRVAADAEVGETLALADGAEDTAKAKLQIDTRFRRAKVYDPERFGERVDVNLHGKIAVEIVRFTEQAQVTQAAGTTHGEDSAPA